MLKAEGKPAVPGLWIGMECTVNRVGEAYVDQCRKNGHRERESDLSLFAELGAERIRYPFLWEWADEGVTEASPYDWSWADDRTRALKRHGLTPIVGFVHHGSGPRHTSLVDPAFPEKLAHYAGEFAARYPWLDDYTPVNEPLTTARFSGLYGFWYPHGKDAGTFVRALYQEIKGTVLSMAAIRRINPRARLIQTDDMGRASGTPGLQYQVDHENERRWLTFDLLCGRVDDHHPLYRYLRDNGLSREELQWLRENRCPPDVIGINHYLLSNRFLDHRREFYPAHLIGGNGREAYADVGAVDTGRAELPTPYSVLEETWKRYGITIAVTEVHVNGPRETQMRWLKEVFDDAASLKATGADITAVTIWALLGSFDWNTCCTRDHGFYESGVFDVRAALPRPTALVQMAKELSRHGRYEHPLLKQPGWWKFPRRAMFARREASAAQSLMPEGPPVLITGATGTLGRAFARICEIRCIPYRIVNRQELDIADPDSVRAALDRHQPWAVINCAGYVKVDAAEGDEERCFRENVTGPETMALLTAQRGIKLLSFSSDMVFDGRREEPYLEGHAVAPLNAYGRSKATAEERVLRRHPGALVVRTSSFFGPWDERNFITNLMVKLARGERVSVASDLIVSPTYVPDLVNASLDLLIDGEKGVLHLTNRGVMSWADFAGRAMEIAGRHGPFQGHLVGASIERVSAKTAGWLAPRPRFSALSSGRANVLPSLDDALHRYFNELEVALPKAAAASLTGGAA